MTGPTIVNSILGALGECLFLFLATDEKEDVMVNLAAGVY